MTFPLSIYFLGLIQLFIISWIDLKTQKIRNWWILVNVLIYILCLFIFPNSYSLDLATWLYPLGFVLLGFPLFLLGIMGAGDSKYLGGLFLIVPVGFQHDLFMKLLGSTILCALILFSIRAIKHHALILWVFKTGQWHELKQLKGSRFSYAPVILLSWAWLAVDIFSK